ncbi:MAG TPA: helix-turn-helix domain-containing protein [Gaiellales bacterium]|nr:helix-turn-helix domain-containing protein [Gaiellales bacterium]
MATSGDTHAPGHPTVRFLTGHATVLLRLALYPESRVRDVAAATGLSRRSVQTIVGDLVRGGWVVRRRAGRRNVYSIVTDRQLHPHEPDGRASVGDLLQILPARHPWRAT